jgi:hypothetical protein
MREPNTPYQRSRCRVVLYLLAVLVLTFSSGSWAQKNDGQSLVVSVQIVKGTRVYRVNRKVVEDTRDNSLLTNLETAAAERGLDYPVIVLVDVKAPFTEVGKLETALDKIDFKHRRLFVGDFETAVMNEFHWDQNGVPIPANARPK